MPDYFHFGSEALTISKAINLARLLIQPELTADGRKKLDDSTASVNKIVKSNRVVYGITTGFGPLCDTRIPDEDVAALQHNLLMSHSVGVGNPLTEELVRLMMITKIQSLVQGFSGVSTTVVERMLWHLREGVIPVVPEKGSVGASGDLAPLAHLFLPLIGLGEVFYKNERRPAGEVLQQTGMPPLQLGPKEGLGLINGTQFILAHAVTAVYRLHNCLDAADIIGAMSLEAFMGSAAPFDERLHQLRPHKGCLYVAKRLRTLLQGSEILQSHQNCERVQDPYSMRCMPQVHGASRDAFVHLRNAVEIELNSVTDNPVVFNENDTISGGNFHGQPLALPLDYAALAAAELGNISDRRSYLLLEGKYGLPRLLIKDAGLNSGLMIPQYTAAALVTENKTLCFPASADSIPTSLGQEDHVSMGSISARKLNTIIGNLEYILAIELLSAAQGIDLRRPLQSSPLLEKVHALVRTKVAFIDKDRIFAGDIEALRNLIADGAIRLTASV
jgi:histidine ammonia-lyase